MDRGVFIVLDGGDGSGKGTQLKELQTTLESEGHIVKIADFPQYGQWSAIFVEKYLRGEFGTLSEIGAKKASLFYALDRFAASHEMKEWLSKGYVVLSNRFVSANKGHQLGKIRDPVKRQEFLDWINEIEYNILELPVPDLTLYLHMPPEISQQLVDKKEARAYVGGKKRDIHEADLDHLKHAEEAFMHCLKYDIVENWDIVRCSTASGPKTIVEISLEIYKKVKKLLNSFD